MNLFVTNLNPTLAAQNLDDKRLRKMILETAQMLCTDAWRRGITVPYKPTHQNHPAVLSLHNPDVFNWALRYFDALHFEYIDRFGKSHASHTLIRPYFSATHSTEGLLPFANCARNSALGLDFTHLPIPDSYRAYLSARWASDKLAPVWTNRNQPSWRDQ